MMNPTNTSIPAEAPISPEQREALAALLGSLSSQQIQWLGGYFTALGMGPPAAAEVPASASAPVEPVAKEAAVQKPLTVLFGSESGNAEQCAADLGKVAKSEGFEVKVADMADYEVTKLTTAENLLVVVSTWGEGDPPERAVPFHETIMSDSAPKLEGLNFAVFALGDTSYADFCQCGKEFDTRLAALGANRVLDRVDADVEFEAPFRAWVKDVLPVMAEASGLKAALEAASATTAPDRATATSSAVAVGAGASNVAVAAAAPPAEKPGRAVPDVHGGAGYSKESPVSAVLKHRVNLNGRGSAKETFHLEIGLDGTGISYEPGDSLGVFPSNCPEVVDDFIRLAGFRGDEIKETDGGYFSLSELLRERYDITGLSKPVAKKYAEVAQNAELAKLLDNQDRKVFNDYAWGREIRDLFLEFPPSENFSMDQLLGMLRNLPARLYSIASSIRAHPEEVHLTVGAVRYEAHGHIRKGVCSTYLGERIDMGGPLSVYVHRNKNFFLPEDSDTPIIMVGPGTGIAPFRAFLEEREAIGAKGRNWLFFGDQHFQTDFLYQTELQAFLKDGLLTKLDVAFSRDQEYKVYVQHRMKQNAAEIWNWLNEGAYFYVCGDASRMAKDVHQALEEIAVEQGGLAPEDATAFVRQLQKDKRYQRDVY